MSKLFHGRERTFRVVLSRLGEEGVIRRADGSASTNEYGKIEDDERAYGDVDTERFIRWYRARDDNPSSATVTGGRIDAENPWIYGKADSRLQEDDRLHFPADGKTYEVERAIDQYSHFEYRVGFINE